MNLPEVKRISKAEFLSDDSAQLIANSFFPESHSIQTYLDAFYPLEAELFSTSSSFILLRRGEVPKVYVDTGRDWTRKELLAFLEGQDVKEEFMLTFQGPDCELVKWIKSKRDHRSLKFALVSLNEDVWGNIKGNLRRQIRKGMDFFSSFTMEPYTQDTWNADLESLKKFIVMNDKLIRDVIVLPKLFEGVEFPKHLFRTRLETSFGEIIGITSCWNKTWTADYHWSFHRYRAKDINLTSLYHWQSICEAQKKGVEFYNLGFEMKHIPGLYQYKMQWHPEFRASYTVKTSIDILQSDKDEI